MASYTYPQMPQRLIVNYDCPCCADCKVCPEYRIPDILYATCSFGPSFELTSVERPNTGEEYTIDTVGGLFPAPIGWFYYPGGRRLVGGPNRPRYWLIQENSDSSSGSCRTQSESGLYCGGFPGGDFFTFSATSLSQHPETEGPYNGSITADWIGPEGYTYPPPLNTTPGYRVHTIQCSPFLLVRDVSRNNYTGPHNGEWGVMWCGVWYPGEDHIITISE